MAPRFKIITHANTSKLALTRSIRTLTSRKHHDDRPQTRRVRTSFTAGHFSSLGLDNYSDDIVCVDTNTEIRSIQDKIAARAWGFSWPYGLEYCFRTLTSLVSQVRTHPPAFKIEDPSGSDHQNPHFCE